MMAKFIRRWMPVLAAGLAAPLLRAAPAPADPAEIAVVAHASVPVNSLTFANLRQILLGDRQYWSSDLKVILLVGAPASREREVLLKTVYQMTEAQFRQYWISKVFRAEASSGPRVVFSAEEAASMVNATAGTIAFVDASRVPKGAKLLRIDGKVPGETGYRLR